MKDNLVNLIEGYIKGICNHIGTYDGNQTNQLALMHNHPNDQINISETTTQLVVNEERLIQPSNEESKLSVQGYTPIEPKYQIPESFTSFSCMMTHWYTVVKNRNASKDTTWRKHLSATEKNNFSD